MPSSLGQFYAVDENESVELFEVEWDCRGPFLGSSIFGPHRSFFSRSFFPLSRGLSCSSLPVGIESLGFDWKSRVWDRFWTPEKFIYWDSLGALWRAGVQLFWSAFLPSFWGFSARDGACLHGFFAIYGGWQWGEEFQLQFGGWSKRAKIDLARGTP